MFNSAKPSIDEDCKMEDEEKKDDILSCSMPKMPMRYKLGRSICVNHCIIYFYFYTFKCTFSDVIAKIIIKF